MESNKASLAWEITRVDQVWQEEEYSAPSFNFTGIPCSYIFFVWPWYRNLAICSRRGKVELNNYPKFHQQRFSYIFLITREQFLLLCTPVAVQIWHCTEYSLNNDCIMLKTKEFLSKEKVFGLLKECFSKLYQLSLKLLKLKVTKTVKTQSYSVIGLHLSQNSNIWCWKSKPFSIWLITALKNKAKNQVIAEEQNS